MNTKRTTLVSTLSLLLFLGSGLAVAEEWDGVSGDAPPGDAEIATADLEIFGPITVLQGPESMFGLRTTVNFDNARHHDPVNDRYAAAGIHFDRDDGYAVHAYELARCGYRTSSPPNAACTTRGPGAPSIAHALNVTFDDDVLSAGLVFGNDVYPGQSWTIEIYDAADQLIGRVGFLGNSNVSVDEFVGVTSRVPFRRLRLSHSCMRYAVCVDDVAFSGSVTGTR